MFNTLRLTVSSANKAYTHTALGSNAVKIGRSLRCEFSIPLEDLSREHCLFEFGDQNFFITDLGSSNGVWIDGERIPAHTRVQITPESQVVLSNLYLMKLAQIEIMAKSDIEISAGSASKEVNPEVETTSFRLDYPVEKEKNQPQPKRKKMIRTNGGESIDKDAEISENLRMVIGFLVAAGILIYHFATQ